MIIVLLLVALLICPPAFAQSAGDTLVINGPDYARAEGDTLILKSPIVTDDMPILRGTLPPDQPKLREVYSEKHPLVAAPFKFTKKAIYWTGRKTKLNKVGAWSWDKVVKSGSAMGDAFEVFGKRTERYHPGMQTISYGMGMILPVLLRLVPNK